MRLFRVLLPVVVGVMGLPLMGQGVSPIAGYVDGQTILVGRLDVSKVDTKGLEGFVHSIMEKQGAEAGGFQGLTMARVAADATLEQFKALGGDRVYVLISFPDLWPAMEPVAALIPVRAGGDIDGMAAMFKALPLGNMLKEPVVEELNDHLLFVGSDIPLKRLKGLHAAARPELTEEVEGSAAVCVALSPTGDMRKVVTQMMPQMPVEFGGGATDVILNDLTSVTLEMNFPPTTEMTLSAHTGKSESAAKAIAEAASHGVEYLKSQPEYQKETTKGGELEGHGERLNAFLESVKPVVKVGEGGMAEARIHLATSDIEECIYVLSPSVSRAQATASRTHTMVNLKQTAIACAMYKSDNKGAWPASINDINRYIASESTFLSPSDPQHRAFVIEPWTGDEMKVLDKASVIVPIVYEAGEEPGGGECVAYSDGHVEFFPTWEKLTEELAKAHEEAKSGGK